MTSQISKIPFISPWPEIHSRGEMSPGWWAALVAMSVTCIACIIGNLSVLVALRKVQRAPSHYALASLASADLLLGTCVLPIAAARELFVFHLYWPICACWSTLDVLCCTASILSLCALGWERWCGITAPLARARRFRRAKLYAAAVWPVSTAVALPTAFIPSPHPYHTGEIPKACTVNTNTGYVFFSVTFSFYLPTCIMLVLYTRILRALASLPQIRAHRGKTPSGDQEQAQDTNISPINQLQSPQAKANPLYLSPKGGHLSIPVPSPKSPTKPAKSPASARLISRQRAATQTIIKLMSLFLLCWTPFFVMLPIDSLCECVLDLTWQWCTWLGYLNSALNPLVYAAGSPSVRVALRASITSSSLRTTCTDVPMTPVVRRTCPRRRSREHPLVILTPM